MVILQNRTNEQTWKNNDPRKHLLNVLYNNLKQT